MPARTVSAFVVCTGVCFAGAHLMQAQEATSANLPDQFQTGEMIQIHKPKKKKAEPTSQIAATAPKQDTAPVPEQPLASEEGPTQMAPVVEKKVKPNRSTASMPPSQKPAPTIEQASSAEEPEVVAAPAEKKHRSRKRPRPAVQPEAAPIPTIFPGLSTWLLPSASTVTMATPRRSAMKSDCSAITSSYADRACTGLSYPMTAGAAITGSPSF